MEFGKRFWEKLGFASKAIMYHLTCHHMRTKIVVTCVVVLVVTVVTVVGWNILIKKKESRNNGPQPPVVTTNDSPIITGGGNSTNRSKAIPNAVSRNANVTNVITSYSPEKSEWKGLKNTAIRSRKVELIPSLLDNEAEEEGEKLSLQLFEKVLIDAEVLNSFSNVNGTISTTARVEGSEFGRVFIVMTDNELRAKITVPEKGKLYAIHYNPADQTHYSLELDLHAEQIDDVGEHPLAPVAQEDEFINDLEIMAAGDLPMVLDEGVASTVIDVMIVYSNDALADSGSVANVNNLIALAISFGNDAHSNTDSGIVLNLIHSQQVNYEGTDDRGTDLTRVTSISDGYIDNVHTLRSTYGADFVCLMVGDYSSDGGIAWLLTSTNGSSAYGYSVVTLPAMDSYTPVHEIGHNMGLSHAKDQNTQPGPTSWTKDAHGFGTTTAGWHWHPTPGADGYCSVMTYTSGGYFADGLAHVRVGLFSDPAITHSGMASGDVADGDSARVLRAMKGVYEAYHDRPLASNTIVVDSPNGGESWTSEYTYNIQWVSKDVTGNVKIELYKGGSLYSTIDVSTLNDRSYEWVIPAGISGDDFRIRITSVDNGVILDESDANFAIDTPFYNEPLNSNPGYTTTGQWEFGVPQSGNMTYGGPGSAYTGTNIYDTDLNSTYVSDSYLTSTVLDCSDYEDVRLTFMAQISVTSASIASIQVTNNGSTWTTLYSGSNLWQTGWASHDYDISSIADGQSTVYIRWAIDHSGGSVRSGFSVDDIKLTGISINVPPAITISDVEVSEGDSGPVSANFTVTLDQAASDTVTVDYATAGNSATSGTDFTAESGTVTFTPGDTSETVTVMLLGDTIDEDNETYYVNLSSPTNATITDGQGVGTITDDDGPPIVTLSVDNDSISESGGVSTITATLSNPTAQTVTVNLGYTGTGGGSDYTASSGSIVISSGTTGTATITATSDTIFEGNETVIVDITGVTNGSESGTQQRTVTIIDDEIELTVTLSVTGTGTVTSASGINCTSSGGSCSTTETAGSSMTYVTTPGVGFLVSNLNGFDSIVSGDDGRLEIIITNKNIEVVFGLKNNILYVSGAGEGSGNVTGIGIDVEGGDSSENVDYGTTVTLAATRNAGSSFDGWSGCDASTGNTCFQTLNQDIQDGSENVTAHYSLYTNQLTVSTDGNGAGIVTGIGIDTGTGDGTTNDNFGTQIVLTATPQNSSIFEGWSGCDNAVGTICTQTLSQDSQNGLENVIATFDIEQYSVEVRYVDDGVVTANGINCGVDQQGVLQNDCLTSVNYGESLTLQATPRRSTFVGYQIGGDIYTTNPFVLVVTEDVPEIVPTYVPDGISPALEAAINIAARVGSRE